MTGRPDTTDPLDTGTEIAEWHRRGAGFCSQTREIERHERYAEVVLALVAVARAARAQAEREPGALDTAIREALARLDGAR